MNYLGYPQQLVRCGNIEITNATKNAYLKSNQALKFISFY